MENNKPTPIELNIMTRRYKEPKFNSVKIKKEVTHDLLGGIDANNLLEFIQSAIDNNVEIYFEYDVFESSVNDAFLGYCIDESTEDYQNRKRQYKNALEQYKKDIEVQEELFKKYPEIHKIILQRNQLEEIRNKTYNKESEINKMLNKYM